MAAAQGWARALFLHNFVSVLLFFGWLVSAILATMGAYWFADHFERKLRFDLGMLIAFPLAIGLVVGLWWWPSRALMAWVRRRIDRLD